MGGWVRTCAALFFLSFFSELPGIFIFYHFFDWFGFWQFWLSFFYLFSVQVLFWIFFWIFWEFYLEFWSFGVFHTAGGVKMPSRRRQGLHRGGGGGGGTGTFFHGSRRYVFERSTYGGAG